MKIQLETIAGNEHSSFNLMFNPRLSDLFYWHFHPEYELVYITAATGTRHVGDHISTYTNSDLVLIGSNIPHLNFDYGVRTDYRKVVVHIKPAFVKSHIDKTPEMDAIATLFKRSFYGIAFKGEVKKRVGNRLMSFESLNPFEQYIELLKIFKLLAESDDFELLHERPFSTPYSEKEQERLRAIYAYVDKNFQQKIELQEVAELSRMTKEAFCRYFKKVTGKTFIEFLNQYRISQAKRMLMNGKNIAEACYNCGFESLSYFSRTFKKLTAESPGVFRKRYAIARKTL